MTSLSLLTFKNYFTEHLGNAVLVSIIQISVIRYFIIVVFFSDMALS